MLIQPLFYFPTTLVYIDDQRECLKAIKVTFEDQCPLQLFESTEEAIKFLTSYRETLSTLSFLRSVSNDQSHDFMENCPIDFDVLDIPKLADNKDRFKEIALLIADYDFRQKDYDGIELCRQFEDLPFKKLLLTGTSSYELAVTAFNECVIHHFIQKGVATLVTELEKSVNNLTKQYFYERTKPLLTILETEGPLPLTDPIFIQYFEDWRKENGITEYYLMDKVGSFLCINAHNQRIHFVVHTNKSLDTFVNFHHEITDGYIPELLQATQERKKIPFFGIGHGAWEEEGDAWKPFFYS